jgi:hypothetical protein
VTRSPLYSLYGETIAGVPIVRGKSGFSRLWRTWAHERILAFGASSKFLRDMLRCVDVVRILATSLTIKKFTVHAEHEPVLLDVGR